MKDIYFLIIKKLKQDLKLIEDNIQTLINEEMEFCSNYQKLEGKKEYCESLIEFFEDIVKYLD